MEEIEEGSIISLCPFFLFDSLCYCSVFGYYGMVISSTICFLPSFCFLIRTTEIRNRSQSELQ